jgi:cell division protein ZipA
LIVELTSDQIAPGGEQLFIPVTILGRHGKHFSGEKIMHAINECDFVYDDSGIFYYVAEDQQGFNQKLLGLANIIEPGIFEQENMRTFETPGLVLYLHLPAPVEAREAFASLIEKGRKLAEVLEGDLCDETRSMLTNQTIGHLKEKVEAYRFKQKMTQLKHHRK